MPAFTLSKAERIRSKFRPMLSTQGSSGGSNQKLPKTYTFNEIREITYPSFQSISSKIWGYRQKAANYIVLEKAFELALTYHETQKAPNSGRPEIFNLIETADLLADWQANEYTVAAALLHKTPINEISNKLSGFLDSRQILKITTLVERKKNLERFTYDFSLGFLNQKESKIQESNCLNAMILDEPNLEVHLLEAADVLVSMKHEASPRTKSSEIRPKEQRAFSVIAPFLRHIGFDKHGLLLDDLALAALSPLSYRQIKSYIDQRVLDNDMETLKDIEASTLAYLTNKGINVLRSKIRIKNVKSTENKIFSIESKKNDSTEEEIKDINGIRYIVQTIDDCYLTYSSLAATYKDLGWEEYLPGRVDLIQNPKDNNYRSIHMKFRRTIKQGDKAIDQYIAVQIRTDDMDFVAEVGSASHINYKDENKPLLNIKDPSAPSRFAAMREALIRQNKKYVYTHEHDGSNLRINELITEREKQKPSPIDLAFTLAPKKALKLSGAKRRNFRGEWEIISLNDPLSNGDTIRLEYASSDQTTEERLRSANSPLTRILITKHLKGKGGVEDKKTSGINFIEVGKEVIARKIHAFESRRICLLSRIIPGLNRKATAFNVLYSMEDFAKSHGYGTLNTLYTEVGTGNGEKEKNAEEIIARLQNHSALIAYPALANDLKKNIPMWIILKRRPTVFRELTAIFSENNINIEKIRLANIDPQIEEDSLLITCNISYDRKADFYAMLNKVKHIYSNITPLNFTFSNNPVMVTFKLKEDKIGVISDIANMLANTGTFFSSLDIQDDGTGNFVLVVPMGKRQAIIKKLRKQLNSLKSKKILSRSSIQE